MQRVVMIAAGLISIAGVTTANAADLPARAPAPYKAPPPIAAIYNWGGFYGGINGGGASSRECYTITSVNNVIAVCTPATVVPRSFAIALIATFMFVAA